VWKDGTEYEGNWHKGKPTGDGFMRYPDGRIYKGKWYRGEREFGWESFDDGIYHGEF
jgi:hypothetical protein